MLNKLSRNPKIIIFLLLCILIIVTPPVIINFKVAELEKDVLLYLREEKGYSLNEIKLINKDFGRLPRFSVWITFKDDIYMDYQYTLKRNQIIQQTYEVNKEGEQQGVEVTTPKHYDPPKAIERR